MPRTSFQGSLNGAEFASVRDLLGAWLQTDDFVIQDRLSGTDIMHEADGLYVYCQEAVATGYGQPGPRNARRERSRGRRGIRVAVGAPPC